MNKKEKIYIEIIGEEEVEPNDIKDSLIGVIKNECGSYNVAVDVQENPDLRCVIDGNALCINRYDFKNLAESPAVFIELNEVQITKIKALLEEKNNEQH